MKARHAAQIRAGILLARRPPMEVAWALTYTRYTGLTFRAYRREDASIHRKGLHPNARCWQPPARVPERLH